MSKVPIRGDEVWFEKVGGNVEVFMKLSSRSVDGFLWNEADGKLRFKKVIKDIALESDLDLYGRNDADYIIVTTNSSIYAWRESGVPDNVTVFDADDAGVWELIIGIGGSGTIPQYEVVLGAVTSLLVTSVTHAIPNVRGVKVLTPGMAEIDLYVEQRANNDVYIESNILLTNYILKIY